MQTTNFSHSGNIGDIWSSIPAMHQHYRNTGKKVNLYLEKNVRAFYYEGAIHPTKDSSGEAVMLNEKMIEMMIPLLMAQPFINECKVWEGEEIHVHLDWFRETYVGLPHFSINRWYFTVFPDLACDLSKVWLNVPDAEKDLAKGKIMVTRSERYQNQSISYEFLKEYEDDIMFCGTMREYNQFCMSYDLNIEKLTINNFLELAQAIKQSRFHITNQTQAFQLSTGLKHPLILELCGMAANCIPIGEHAYDFFNQQALEYYTHKLMGNAEKFLAKIKKEAASKETAE